MTDRIYAISVALEHDIRDDDIEPLLNAIRMLRGVAAVKTHVSDLEAWNARVQARQELVKKLYDALRD